MSNNAPQSPPPKLTYLGSADGAGPRDHKGILRRLPLGFAIVVVAPTIAAAIYFLLVAPPIYVSEARFVVRSQNDRTPNALGIALQSVGMSSSSSDAFMVHAYMKSRDAVRDVARTVKMDALVPHSSPMANEDLFKAFQKRITVGFDSTNGLSTLRVRAFDARSAQRAADSLLDGGERVVNELNKRAAEQAIREAGQTLALAEEESLRARDAIARFRNDNRMVDPARMATETGQVVGALMTALAETRAERSQVASQAPDSPLLATLDARVRAIEGQIASERARTTSGPDALAPQVGAYENLEFQRKIAEQALVAARVSYEEAASDARRQKLYLDRVVEPNLADKAMLPRRGVSVLLTFLSCLLAYGIGTLIWAGVREHRQT
ncbi:Chain length determinant protein [compost metagenome]